MTQISGQNAQLASSEERQKSLDQQRMQEKANRIVAEAIAKAKARGEQNIPKVIDQLVISSTAVDGSTEEKKKKKKKPKEKKDPKEPKETKEKKPKPTATKIKSNKNARMWEVRVTTGVPSDFTCEKCTQLQLRTDCVRELELDELQIIREAEGVMERSYKEVVTPT
eukprot:g46718.t1